MKTWLLIDVSYLAWRAFHSTPDLSWEGVKTSVIFGLLRDVQNLQDLHATRRVVFAFDVGRPWRSVKFEGYKGSRHNYEEMDRTELLARGEVKFQLKNLRNIHLNEIGYRNIWFESGYEADDLIAAGCSALPDGDTAIIVSRDGDFYQLLNDRVSIWNPSKKRMITADWFRDEYGISPEQWADVKAIAGCGSDEVPGVKGIGEITAAKFLAGTLKHTTKAFAKIVEGDAIWKRNLPLVKLPYEGCPTPEFLEDETTEGKWRKVAKSLGIKSLRGLV